MRQAGDIGQVSPSRISICIGLSILLSSCYFGPLEANSPVERMLWTIGGEHLENELALHLMSRVRQRQTDSAGRVILVGQPSPTCDEELVDAGLSYVGNVESERVYRTDQWGIALIISRNIIVSCGPDRVRAHVGYTGM